MGCSKCTGRRESEQLQRKRYWNILANALLRGHAKFFSLQLHGWSKQRGPIHVWPLLICHTYMQQNDREYMTLTDLSQIYAAKWQRVHRASSSIIWNMYESEIVWVLQLQYYNAATVNYGTWHRHICLKTLHHPSIYYLVSMSIGKLSIQSPSLSSGRGGESLPCMPWGWKQPHILMEALCSDLPDIGDLTHTEWDASLMIRILISSTFILKKYFPNLSHLLAWPCRRYQATIHSNCLKVQEGLTHCRNFHRQFIDEKYRTAMKYNLLTERGLTIERTGHRGVC